MASVTYHGTFGYKPAGTDGLSASVTGSAIPHGMKITSITYQLQMHARLFTKERNWIVHWFAIGSENGSPAAPYETTAMSDDSEWISGHMNFSAEDISIFESGSFTLYAKANTDNDTISYMENFNITVNYTEDTTPCVEPDTVLLNGSAETVFSAGGTLQLSWSGAKTGAANSIRGYRIYYCDSTDNWLTWGDFQFVGDVETTQTSGSIDVESPGVGTQRKFFVFTLSAVGDEYNSSVPGESPVVIGGHPALDGFTDPILTAGKTMVKALHMQELQSRVNTMRQYYGLSDYAFSEIVSGQTSLGGWTMHVNEIRAAIDEIGIQHDTWLVITENKPRADVITQMRNVVLGEHGDPVEPPVVDTTSALDTAVLDTMELAE